MADPFKTGTRPDGSTFYWFRVDVGRDPVTGKRRQLYKSFDRLKDVRARLAKLEENVHTQVIRNVIPAKTEYARIINDVAEMRYVARSATTVRAYLQSWLPAHTRDLEEAGKAKVRHLPRPVLDRLGDQRLQSLTRADVDALVDWMLTAARVRAGKPGTGLSARTVKDTLAVLQRALDDAADERLVTHNPCRRVKRPRQGTPEHELWSDAEMARFEVAAATNRLAPIFLLQCLGMRPEEACGLRWRREVDLKAGTLDIRAVRTLVDGRPVEKATKTDAGRRTLPLDDALVAALRKFRAVQAAEKLTVGPAYSDGGYVACDELGLPLDPARLRRVWYRLMKQAGVPKVTPYTASRHAAASYLANVARVSPAVIAAWLGHSDASFTMKTYVHARPEDLAAARDALAERRQKKAAEE